MGFSPFFLDFLPQPVLRLLQATNLSGLKRRRVLGRGLISLDFPGFRSLRSHAPTAIPPTPCETPLLGFLVFSIPVSLRRLLAEWISLLDRNLAPYPPRRVSPPSAYPLVYIARTGKQIQVSPTMNQADPPE
jgi:hypothetical protein